MHDRAVSDNANRFNHNNLNEAFEHLIIHHRTAGFFLVKDTQLRDSIVERTGSG